MRILYVASQTESSESLQLEREITDIQRQLASVALSSAKIVFMPDTTLEELPLALSQHKPDILHISAHGDKEGIWFAKQGFDGAKRDYVLLTAERLCAFLDPTHLPRLVFVNACDSHFVAKTLSEAGMIAIGTSAPITNQAAIAASRLLYQRLLAGRSVDEAFKALNALVTSLDLEGVTLGLYTPTGLDPAGVILQKVPRLAARLAENKPLRASGRVSVNIGVIGCPPETSQVCFFTDDMDFTEPGGDLTVDLAEVVRDSPRRGEIWTDADWKAVGDCRVAACGITGSGETYSVSSQLIEALSYYAGLANPSPAYEKLLAQAISQLRDNDGAGLADWQKRSAEKAKAPAKADTTKRSGANRMHGVKR